MDKDLRKIYAGKKVLITGHTGFKGSWLSLWLTKLNANVIGYSLEPPTSPSMFEAINLEEKVTHIIGDIRDEAHFLSVMEKYTPEFVFHLAAQPIVSLSYEKPKFTYDTNVMGTINVLESIRRISSVRVCLIVTSDKCYKNKEWVYGYREIDAVGGYDPYSSSKACAELVVASYLQSFFNQADYGNLHNVALSSARAGNVLGGGDWGLDRLVPDCMRALSQEQKIIIRNPLAIRPWQYVLDPLFGYLTLGALMYKKGAEYCGPWNFGPNDQNIITVEDLVQRVVTQWGSGTYNIGNLDKPHETHLLKLDASKSKALLGWNPTYDMSVIIKRTVDWYRNFYSGVSKRDLYNLSLNEIEEFERLK